MELFASLPPAFYDAFAMIFRRGVGAGLLTVCIVLLRILLQSAPRRMHCFLWLLLAVYLVYPVGRVSDKSVFNLIPQVQDFGIYYQNQPEQPELSVDFPAIPGYPDNQPEHSAKSGVHTAKSYFPPMITGYLFGCAAMLGYALSRTLALRRRLREAVPLRENIWLCDAVTSPFILGLIRPRIYLPSSVDETQMEYILAHERAHLRRLDHLWKPVGYLLLAVYWFQPLMWAAYLLFCRDIERACDESAIRDYGPAERKAYASALLTCATQQTAIFSCPLAFGEVCVKERIASVLRYRNPSFWMLAFAAAVCLLAADSFLSVPPQKAPANASYMESFLVNGAVCSVEVMDSGNMLLNLPPDPPGYDWTIESEPPEFQSDYENIQKRTEKSDGYTQFHIVALRAGAGTMIFRHSGGGKDERYALDMEVGEGIRFISFQKR